MKALQEAECQHCCQHHVLITSACGRLVLQEKRMINAELNASRTC